MFDSSELPLIAAAVCAGILLGGLYFGGLWWTVGRMPQVRHPLNLYFGSLVVRLTLVLTAFYGVLSYTGWPQLAAALAGFVAARLLLIRFFGRTAAGDATQWETV
jgi:F1F0 ATPase subunit 2